jgi:hypothetical protein
MQRSGPFVDALDPMREAAEPRCIFAAHLQAEVVLPIRADLHWWANGRL